jgi:hypothetical protein
MPNGQEVYNYHRCMIGGETLTFTEVETFNNVLTEKQRLRQAQSEIEIVPLHLIDNTPKKRTTNAAKMACYE